MRVKLFFDTHVKKKREREREIRLLGDIYRHKIA